MKEKSGSQAIVERIRRNEEVLRKLKERQERKSKEKEKKDDQREEGIVKRIMQDMEEFFLLEIEKAQNEGITVKELSGETITEREKGKNTYNLAVVNQEGVHFNYSVTLPIASIILKNIQESEDEALFIHRYNYKNLYATQTLEKIFERHSKEMSKEGYAYRYKLESEYMIFDIFSHYGIESGQGYHVLTITVKDSLYNS